MSLRCGWEEALQRQNVAVGILSDCLRLDCFLCLVCVVVYTYSMRLTRFIAPLAVAGLLLTGCSSDTTSPSRNFEPSLSHSSSPSPGKAIGGKIEKKETLKKARHLDKGNLKKETGNG